MGMPVYEMLGGPVDPRGVRGYYHADAWTLGAARELREEGVTPTTWDADASGITYEKR